MSQAPSPTPASPKARFKRVALIAGVTVVVVLLVLVASRTLIAQALATNWLQSYGVASQVEVRSLSLTGLKARLRLGAEGAPDATADEVDVAYGLDGPWNGHGFGVTTRSVRLVRPHVVMRWDGKRLSYGALTRLVQDFLARPANPKVPTPNVTVEAGRVDLASPYGVVTLTGDATIDAGALTSLKARLAPSRLRLGATRLTTAGGPVSLRRQGQTLALDVQAPFEAATAAGAWLGGAQLALTGTLPYPRGGAIAGPVTLDGRINADRLDLPLMSLAKAMAQLHFDGAADGHGVSGQGRMDLQGASLRTDAVSATSASGVATLTRLTLATDKGPIRIEGAGHLSLKATDAAAGGYTASALALDGEISRASWSGGQAPGWSAAGQGRANLRGAAGGGLGFSDLTVTVSGQAAPTALVARLAITGHGSADAATARRYADLLAPADPAYAAALQRAARGFAVQAPSLAITGGPRAMRVTTAAPIRLASTSGAVLTLDAAGRPLFATTGERMSGSLEAALSGGGLPTLKVSAPDWTSAGGVTSATLSVSGLVNLGPVQALALQAARGNLRLDAASTRFTLAGCTPLSAKGARYGETAAADLAARLCPTAAPLVEAAGGGWRVAGRFEAARGELPDMRLRLSDAAGRFDLSSEGRGGAAGSLDLAALRLADTTPEPRFNPLIASGQARIAGDRLTGRFLASQPATGRALASVDVEHDLHRGLGHAVIESHGLTFAKDGLQPGAISPLAAIARDAQGAVDFDGRFDWTARGVSSSGRLRVDDLGFSSPLGQVKGGKADIRFTSLAPLVTAPGQTLTVASIAGVVPMTNVAAGFSLTADAVTLDTASADAAKGRLSLEPMRLDFAGDGTVRGALLLDHVDLGELLASSSLGDSVKMQMVVIGRLPFEAKPPKFSFLQGHISATQPGRISISRTALEGVNTGAAGSSTGAAVNAVQDLAYDALENLAFETLEADVASRPGGRLGLIFRIKGRYDPPVKQTATLAIADVLNGTAFQKKIPLPSDTPINLNLDTSLNFDELMQTLADIWKHDESQARSSATVQAGGR